MLKPAIPPGPNRSPHRRRRWSKPRDTFAGEATEGGEHRARNVVEVLCEAQLFLRWWRSARGWKGVAFPTKTLYMYTYIYINIERDYWHTQSIVINAVVCIYDILNSRNTLGTIILNYIYLAEASSRNIYYIKCFVMSNNWKQCVYIYICNWYLCFKYHKQISFKFCTYIVLHIF